MYVAKLGCPRQCMDYFEEGDTIRDGRRSGTRYIVITKQSHAYIIVQLKHLTKTMSISLRHITSRSLASCRKIAPTKHLSSSTTRRKDPWPMPHTPEHINSTASPTDVPPQPLPRHGESLETMRARLVYQSRKRGTLESDLLLSTFAREHLSTMNPEELSEFDKVRCHTVVNLSLFDGYDSYVTRECLFFLSSWTNQTGIYITGQQGNGRHLSGGRTRSYLRS
jgi:Flavinator of succinate dehydrogenase